ncbi:hypothetical protein B0H14DRAFT_3857497 [Mycena olivaceomarginata]|nr:hypothetical protein B0H14DRAFT_3857497 [Mycena olivaceomarginata]
MIIGGEDASVSHLPYRYICSPERLRRVYICTRLTHVGDTAYFANQNWTIPVYVFTTAAVALPVQIYLVARYWKFAHKHVITLSLGLLILAAFGGSFTCGFMVAVFPAFEDRDKLKIPAILWLITEAAADIGIAVALLWEFLKTRPTSTETKSVVKRLITVTLQTGTATAAIAGAALVGRRGLRMVPRPDVRAQYAVKPQCTQFAACMDPLDIESSYLYDTQYKRRLCTAGTEMDTNLSGLCAHRTAVVHIEGQQEMNPQSLMTKKSMHHPEHTTDIEMGHLSCKKEQEEGSC